MDIESRDIHKIAGDPGGTTHFGFAQKYNQDIDVTKLTEPEAKQRFIERWWDKYKCDEMKQPLAAAFICTVFNTGAAVNSYTYARHYSDAVEKFLADIVIRKYAIHPKWPEGLVVRAMKTYKFAKKIEEMINES